MNKMSGIMLSEVMTYIIMVIVVIAVGIGIYANARLDEKYESTEAIITAIKEKAVAVGESGNTLICDNSMLTAEALDNEWVTFSIIPVEIVRADPSKGYGAGIKLVSKAKSVNKESFTVTSRLFESLREEDKTAVRDAVKDEENISFVYLASDSAICSGVNTGMANDTESEQPEEKMVAEGGTSS